VPTIVLIKTLAILAFIVLLIYGCVAVAKKRQGSRHKLYGDRIKLIEQKYIDTKLTVSLIVVNDEYMVLAAGPQGLALARLGPQADNPCHKDC